MNQEQQNQGSSSCLFTVRLWPESMGPGSVELRAEVRHVQSGEVRYFRDWGSLTAFLVEKAGEATPESGVLQPLVG